MSENSEHPEVEGTHPTIPADPRTNGSGVKREESNHGPAAGAESDEERSVREYIESLKQGLDQYRLSPELKAQLLAEMPPPEEMERLYREVLEHGGYSTEDMLDLIREIESQS
jgi:hypothetical protein